MSDEHGHAPADPNADVVRARPPGPLALVMTGVVAAATLVALISVAVAGAAG